MKVSIILLAPASRHRTNPQSNLLCNLCPDIGRWMLITRAAYLRAVVHVIVKGGTLDMASTIGGNICLRFLEGTLDMARLAVMLLYRRQMFSFAVNSDGTLSVDGLKAAYRVGAASRSYYLEGTLGMAPSTCCSFNILRKARTWMDGIRRNIGCGIVRVSRYQTGNRRLQGITIRRNIGYGMNRLSVVLRKCISVLLTICPEGTLDKEGTLDMAWTSSWDVAVCVLFWEEHWIWLVTYGGEIHTKSVEAVSKPAPAYDKNPKAQK
uniref:Uncharacterized protein n=1 Tax=Panagrellus redivivus TaxID=6233 RepID=A0A7E4UM09_PANRE